MAYKRMKPVRRFASTPGAPQFPTELRRGAELRDQRRWQEAQDHLENLHLRYPTRIEPLSVLLDVALESGDMVYYQEIVERMLKIAPDDPDILLAQAGANLSNGQLALALERFQRFLGRWPQHEEAPEARQTLSTLEEKLTKRMDTAGLHQANRFELAARNDEIQAFITQGRIPEARSVAQRLLHDNALYAPALNNLALTYMLEGQWDQVVSYAQRVLEFDPDNVHALGNLARSLHFLGRREETALYTERMKASKAFAADKIYKLVETLSFLGDDAGVLEVYRKAQRDQDDSALQTPLLHHLAGAAAMRLGQEKEAQRYWKEALKLDPEFTLTKENLADLKHPIGERDAPWAFSFNYWLNRSSLRDFGKLMEADKSSNPEQAIEKALHTVLQSNPALETLLPLLLERGDPAGRQFALFFIKLAKTPAMLTALPDFALSQHGVDQMRMDAANAAIQAGILTPGKVRLWIQGAWQEVMLTDWELHEEATGAHSPRVETLAEQAMEALYKRDGNRAEKLLMQALELEPEAPDLLNNLVSAYRLQKRTEESDELIYQINDRFPNYFFGKVNRAHLYITAGRLEDAEQLLTPLTAQKRLHFSEFAGLAQVQVELLLAKKEPEAARKWYDMWKEALPDHPALLQYRLQFDGPALLKPGAFKSLFKRRSK